MSLKSVAYCFTLNNWSETEYDTIVASKYDYLIIGKERGNLLETPHLQGYIYKKSMLTFKGMQKIMSRAHIEKAKGGCDSNVTYCSKQKDFAEFGTRPIGQGTRTDLELVKDVLVHSGKMSDVVQMATSYQSVRMAECILKYTEQSRDFKPYVQWFHGLPGVGKTREAYVLLPNAYTSSNGKWWEGYDAHADVIIDDFRPDYCKFDELLRLLDRYAHRIECKGGSRQFLAKNIIITSTKHPSTWFSNVGENIQQLLRRIDIIREFTPVVI